MAVGETTASAYNTGQHFVVTERALRRFNFKLGSLQWIEAAGYTVDEAANYPDKAMFEGGDAQRSKNIAHYFHYDALNGSRSVERELAWQRIAVATVVRAAAQRRDPQTILHVIGIMSHAIQDFYSHSNFADFDWVGLRGYRIVTIDDVQRDTWESQHYCRGGEPPRTHSRDS